eukprot:145338-Alexandrium_andersonii.AAC.1
MGNNMCVWQLRSMPSSVACSVVASARAVASVCATRCRGDRSASAPPCVKRLLTYEEGVVHMGAR